MILLLIGTLAAVVTEVISTSIITMIAIGLWLKTCRMILTGALLKITSGSAERYSVLISCTMRRDDLGVLGKE